MCSAYRVSRQTTKVKFRVEDLRLIRRTDRAPAVLEGAEEVEMRWGFERAKFGPIVNARTDKLEGPMWREAYGARRCLIPLSEYFEWRAEGKRKQAFRVSGAGMLYAAGIWEESRRFGPCFSMLTREAQGEVAEVHHRMPCLLGEGQREEFLGFRKLDLDHNEVGLTVSECESPLKRRGGLEQGELF